MQEVCKRQQHTRLKRREQNLTVCSCVVCGRRAAVRHLASQFIWLVGLCLINSSAAQSCLEISGNVADKAYKGRTDIGDCLDFTSSESSVGKMAFFESSIDTINVPYASSAYSLYFDKMAFKAISGVSVNMEC